MSVKAQVIDAFNADLVVTLIICTIVAALWAGIRPDMVRDSEGRRLPPSLTARITFVVLFTIAFLALTMAFHFGGFLVKKLSSVIGVGAHFFQRFDGQAPILALLATCGLYSLAPFREVEQHFLAWLHSTRHLRGDVRLLTRHLVECSVTPTSEEHRRNIESLAKFDVYVTDVDTKPINLSSVATWRKTASLLRAIREWSAEKPRILSDEELAGLAELEKSHSRKTRLAMDILRMLEHMRESGDGAKALSGVTQILTSASHSNRREVSNIEERVQANLQGGSMQTGERPVRLSADELREYLKKIESYFHVEYRLMLEQASDLAAKAILRAGDEAPQRLIDLKTAGFEGLGSINPLSAHRIIWFLLSVAVGGFLIYYLAWFDEAMSRVQDLGQKQGRVYSEAELAAIGRTFLIGIAVFVSSIALASLIGALFASSNAHVRARETPWGTYFLAGIVAVIAFAGMQLMRETVTLSLDATLAADLRIPADSVTRLKNFAPWTVLPFLTAVGICWLARQNPWKRVEDKIGHAGTALIERAVDGFAIGLLMLVGLALAMGLMPVFGLTRSAILKPGFDPEVARNLFVFGFFVGALVIRDVRSAAHAQLVAPAAPRGANIQGVVPFAKAAA